MSAELTIKGDVEVLRLQPGDVLVVTLDKWRAADDLAPIRDGLKTVFPGHEVVIVANGVRLSVTREEVAA